MLIFLGSIIIVLSIVALILINFKISNFSNLNFVSNKNMIISLMTGVILIILNGVFFYAEAGYSYLVQYPTGKQIAVLDPGLKFKFWGQVYPWKKVITVKFDNDKDNDEKYSGSSSTIKVRFNDAVQANVSLSARFRLPEDDQTFILMAIEFRNQKNLINSSLLPSCKEVTKNAARLISAQEYIAGRGGEFEFAVLDQLEKGTYILDAKPLGSVTDTIKVDSLYKRTIETNVIKRFAVTKRLNADGSIKRKKHPINQYKIFVSQATVENVDPEDKFKVMLGQQRDAAAKASIEKEKAKQAEFEKQRIIAEGESAKASKKVELETEQVQILIAAETEMKKADILRQTKQKELEAARLEAQSIKVLADAEAYKKQKIMQADGALDKKLATYERVMSTWANAYSQRPVPTYYFNGGNSNGGVNGMFQQFMMLQNMNALKDLNLKIEAK